MQRHLLTQRINQLETEIARLKALRGDAEVPPDKPAPPVASEVPADIQPHILLRKVLKVIEAQGTPIGEIAKALGLHPPALGCILSGRCKLPDRAIAPLSAWLEANGP